MKYVPCGTICLCCNWHFLFRSVARSPGSDEPTRQPAAPPFAVAVHIENVIPKFSSKSIVLGVIPDESEHDQLAMENGVAALTSRGGNQS